MNELSGVVSNQIRGRAYKDDETPIGCDGRRSGELVGSLIATAVSEPINAERSVSASEYRQLAQHGSGSKDASDRLCFKSGTLPGPTTFDCRVESG